MGLLEDIGRAPQVGQLAETLRRTASDAQDQDRQERLDTSAIELNTLEANKRRNELQEQKRVKDIQSRSLDITTHPMYLSLDPESQKHTLNYMSSGGYTDKSGIGTIGSIQNGVQSLEGSKEDFGAFTQVVIQGKRKAFDAAQKEYSEALEAGKSPEDKNVQLLQQKVSATRTAYNSAIDASGKHSQALEKQEIASTLATEQAIKVAEAKQTLKLQIDALGGKIGATEERLKAILFKEGKFTAEQQRVWDEITKAPDKASFLQKVYTKAISKHFVEQDDVDKIMAAASTYYDDNLAAKGAKPSDATAGMPPAEGNEGKTIKDTDTGKRYKSDGEIWSLM